MFSSENVEIFRWLLRRFKNIIDDLLYTVIMFKRQFNDCNTFSFKIYNINIYC